ncbi:MAG TPA: antibiotic biosynthesis monooxygenase [Candidatus Limnocylindrales bacterium]|jgi:hypothetical protein
MPLRLFHGRVTAGREADFIELLRRGVERESPAPGLLSYMCGYRREGGVDRFLLASAWESEADIERAVGPDPLGHPNTLVKMAGLIELDSVAHYELIRPLPSGILDAPGAVIRQTHCYVKPGRFEELRDWLARKARDIDASHVMLGWMLGWRRQGERIEGVGVSAWPSPLQYEAVADAGLASTILFREMEDFVTDFSVEVYQAIELQLSSRLASLGGRRLIVARFDSSGAADQARLVLSDRLAPNDGSDVSVARLAGPADAQVFVARVMLADHAVAERLIHDHGGEILFEADERGQGGRA